VRAHARRPTGARCAGRTRLCTRARHAASAGSGSSHTHIMSPFLAPRQALRTQQVGAGQPSQGGRGDRKLIKLHGAAQPGVRRGQQRVEPCGQQAQPRARMRASPADPISISKPTQQGRGDNDPHGHMLRQGGAHMCCRAPSHTPAQAPFSMRRTPVCTWQTGASTAAALAHQKTQSNDVLRAQRGNRSANASPATIKATSCR